MLYSLRTICFAGAAISFLILCIVALIGGIVIKYKKTLTNVALGLLVACCIFTVGLIIFDTAYSFKLRNRIAVDYKDAHNFNNKGSIAMFESYDVYYTYKYDVKTNTIIVNKINSDSSKELKDAL